MYKILKQEYPYTLIDGCTVEVPYKMLCIN